MSTGKQSPEPAKESSQSPELVRVISQNRESSLEPHLQETKEPASDFQERPSDNAASDTVPEESMCLKCGMAKRNCVKDLEPLPEAELVCKCDSELDETQGENRTNLESDANIYETEKVKSEIQSLAELGESTMEKSPDQDFSADFGKDATGKSTSDFAPENLTISKNLDPKPLPLMESGQQKSDPKLNEWTKIDLNEETDTTVEEISRMEEGEDGNQSPGASSETSMQRLLRNYPRNVRCTEDSGNSEPNRRSSVNENLGMLCLLCAIMCPVLIILSITFAYQLYHNHGRFDTESNIMEDLDGNSTADEE